MPLSLLRILRPALCALLLLACASVSGQPEREYRGYWVETFNTPLGTRADIDRVISAATQSNANALFVQVRRRGDSWYLDSKEPLTEVTGVGEPDSSPRWTLDPLRYLVDQAHARGIEVHAFTIIGAIYNDNPATRLPRDPKHVFLQHFWDRSANAPYSGRQQWATRAIGPNLEGTSYDGHRFGNDWYLDLGHPDAAQDTLDVLTHLVSHYDVDGIHLDRIRYPEARGESFTGEPSGYNVGYNATSVARFNARYGRSGNPKSNDPLWNSWRREQVTSFVRRLYLNVKSIRPSVKVSGALITFSNGPSASGGFENTETFGRVFQNWKAWAEEGIMDVLVPMDYKREHTAAQAAQFDDWMRFTIATAHANGRLGLIGLGAYLNGIEGTLRQARRAREAGADGIVFYSLAATNEAVTSNPFTYPSAGVSTPERSSSDFFAALRTGASASGATRYESPALAPLFVSPVPVPATPLTHGHVMGFARDVDGVLLDGATVTIEHLGNGSKRTVTSDGNGFFGFAQLLPGTYRVSSAAGSSCELEVTAGEVITAEVPAACRPKRRAVAHAAGNGRGRVWDLPSCPAGDSRAARTPL